MIAKGTTVLRTELLLLASPEAFEEAKNDDNYHSPPPSPPSGLHTTKEAPTIPR